MAKVYFKFQNLMDVIRISGLYMNLFKIISGDFRQAGNYMFIF